MQPKSTKLNLKLLPHPDTNWDLGKKVSFIRSEKETHKYLSTVYKNSHSQQSGKGKCHYWVVAKRNKILWNR